jgi:hypothetical protein
MRALRLPSPMSALRAAARRNPPCGFPDAGSAGGAPVEPSVRLPTARSSAAARWSTLCVARATRRRPSPTEPS